MAKTGIAQAQYGDLPDARPVIYINGVAHYIQRMNILDLADWKERNHLRPAGRAGGPNTWPPAVLYERIDNDSE